MQEHHNWQKRILKEGAEIGMSSYHYMRNGKEWISHEGIDFPYYNEWGGYFVAMHRNKPIYSWSAEYGSYDDYMSHSNYSYASVFLLPFYLACLAFM